MKAIRLAHLDVLRVAAMVYIVMFWHLDNYFPKHVFSGKYFEIVKFSFLSLFMYISGYLLSSKCDIDCASGVMNFLQKRFVRIYPLFVVSMVLYYFLGFVDSVVFWHGILMVGILLNDAPITLWLVSCLLVYYFLFQVMIFRFTVAKFSVLWVLLCS